MKVKKAKQRVRSNHAFHLMAKPAGPACNLKCDYCFYVEKQAFFKKKSPLKMSDEVLEAYTKKYIEAQPGPAIEFAWQGGEPTLLGIDFFKRALAFQRKYNNGKQISNALQTNGTLLNEKWCSFLSENNFLVGVSIDGPPAVHDVYRKDLGGNPTCSKVVRALELMREHGVEFNALVTVNRENSRRPLEVYNFLKQQGVRFIQFIPIVERPPDSNAEKWGLPLAAPPAPGREEPSAEVTPWSVEPREYGDFLTLIFQEWVRGDVGTIFVMNFEWLLAAWLGAPEGACYLAPRCGRNLIIEYNGDLYPCDHFMYPGYRLGNILKDDLAGMVESKKQAKFGAVKETGLPKYCHACDYLFACRGGCPKQRFAKTPDGEPGLNYLCPGLKKFNARSRPLMEYMANLIRRGVPVTGITAVADELLSKG